MRVELDSRPDILGVLINGKVVPGAVAFDMEAGTVEICVPTVPKLGDESGTFELEEDEVVWETKTLTGKIQLAIRKK